MTGPCRFCKCTHVNPCPEGCGWADRSQTLCTACVDIEKAWRALTIAKPPNVWRAFFRGYTAGVEDERAIDVTFDLKGRAIATNSYVHAKSRSGRCWQLGFKAGEESLF